MTWPGPFMLTRGVITPAKPLSLPDVQVHIEQHGNSHQVIFISEGDSVHYLDSERGGKGSKKTKGSDSIESILCSFL
jgi:hypothetical protein